MRSRPPTHDVPPVLTFHGVALYLPLLRRGLGNPRKKAAHVVAASVGNRQLQLTLERDCTWRWKRREGYGSVFSV